MKKIFMIAVALGVVPLAACGKSPSDKLADRVEKAADAKADAMEKDAEALEQRAEDVRTTGEQRADAIDAADRNAPPMTQEQRDAIVANKAPAVR